MTMIFHKEKKCHVTDKQSGMVLFFVLVIFAISALVARDLINQLFKNSNFYGRQLNHIQAEYYARGAEQYVAYLLESDFKKSVKVGTPSEKWQNGIYQLPSMFEVEQGNIKLYISDDQSKFNINLLAGQNSGSAVNAFSNLLMINGMSPSYGRQIQEFIGRLYESDSTSKMNQSKLISLSELRLLNLLSGEEYKRLSSFVSVLPDTSVGLNIMTAEKETIMALSENSNEYDIDTFIKLRESGAIKNSDDLKKVQESFKNLKNITYRSIFFSSYIAATFQDKTYYLHTRFHRDKKTGKVSVLNREHYSNPMWAERFNSEEGS